MNRNPSLLYPNMMGWIVMYLKSLLIGKKYQNRTVSKLNKKQNRNQNRTGIR